jgi:hypothetical protein
MYRAPFIGVLWRNTIIIIYTAAESIQRSRYTEYAMGLTSIPDWEKTLVCSPKRPYQSGGPHISVRGPPSLLFNWYGRLLLQDKSARPWSWPHHLVPRVRMSGFTSPINHSAFMQQTRYVSRNYVLSTSRNIRWMVRLRLTSTKRSRKKAVA